MVTKIGGQDEQNQIYFDIRDNLSRHRIDICLPVAPSVCTSTPRRCPTAGKRRVISRSVILLTARRGSPVCRRKPAVSSDWVNGHFSNERPNPWDCSLFLEPVRSVIVLIPVSSELQLESHSQLRW